MLTHQDLVPLDRDLSNAQRRIDQLESTFYRIEALWKRETEPTRRAVQDANKSKAVIDLLVQQGVLVIAEDESLSVSPKLLQLLEIDWSTVLTQAGGLRQKKGRAKSSGSGSQSSSGSTGDKSS